MRQFHIFFAFRCLPPVAAAGCCCCSTLSAWALYFFIFFFLASFLCVFCSLLSLLLIFVSLPTVNTRSRSTRWIHTVSELAPNVLNSPCRLGCNIASLARARGFEGERSTWVKDAGKLMATGGRGESTKKRIACNLMVGGWILIFYILSSPTSSS